MKSKSYRGKLSQKDINVEYYDSLSELFREGKKRSLNFGDSRDSLSHDLGFKDWESLEASAFTYQKDVSTLRQKVKAASSAGVKLRDKLSLEGGNPCVPAYLMGVPTAMIRREPSKTNKKFIKLVIDSSYSCRVTKKEVESYYEKVVEYIATLNAQGYRISIQAFGSFSDPDRQHASVVFVRIKDAGEKFNLKKIMFSISHEAMFRGVMFDWYQRFPKAVRIDGYGIPVPHWREASKEAYLEDLGIKDTIVYYQSDFKRILGGLK